MHLLAWFIPNPIHGRADAEQESGERQELIHILADQRTLESEMLDRMRTAYEERVLRYRASRAIKLHLGPSEASAVELTLASGTTFRQRERAGRWIHVETEEQTPHTGWIHDDAGAVELLATGGNSEPR